MRTRRIAQLAVGTLALASGSLAATAATGGPQPAAADSVVPAAAVVAAAAQRGSLPGGFKHLVVIYEENHSFDNLYGGWGRVGADRVNGTRSVPQVAQNGTAYGCLLQDDVNLASPPLPATCADPSHGVSSAFANHTFTIDDYIHPESTTCPPTEGAFNANGWLDGTGSPGGCTRDLVHRFYQDQYQEDGGRMDRYATGSDAVGLTLGQYDTKALPIYTYLHGTEAPHYVIADHLFQGAFGGSFLNHQWLIAARTPVDTSGQAVNSVLDSAGMPNSYPLYAATGPVADTQWTVACKGGQNNYVKACGAYAINTIQPSSVPHGSGVQLPLIDDRVFPNIGDRMSRAGITWNWYAGGWDDAVAGTPGANFQYHHQPFNYFKNYAVGAPGRSHLQDETDFMDAATAGTLPTVSFVKPYGTENEHPGYASEPDGSDHLVDLLQTVMAGPQARDTLVIVTYDEFGGQADHVAPPKVDNWGPGTRIPALIVSARFRHDGVDHTLYDTTSIIATIEHSFHLKPLTSRDANVNPMNASVAKGLRG